MTLEVGKGNHPKFLPFAFTEQGVAMLSAVLNSQRAVNASIAIMRAFVMIRQWALTYQELSDKLSDLEKTSQPKVQRHRSGSQVFIAKRTNQNPGSKPRAGWV